MKKFFYRVREGDTALSVSAKFAVPLGALIEDNALTEEPEAGDIMRIEIPSSAPYAVRPLDTAENVGEIFGVPPNEILIRNGVPYLFYGMYITTDFKAR